MGSIYLLLVFSLLWITGLIIAIQKYITFKYKTISSILIYLLLVFIILIQTIKDIKSYYNFNNLVYNKNYVIKINNVEIVDENKKIRIFNELKNDYFTWNNHPQFDKNEYEIQVINKKNRMKFLVRNTSNQGVLVSRFNEQGKEFVFNRNDYLLLIIKDSLR